MRHISTTANENSYRAFPLMRESDEDAHPHRIREEVCCYFGVSREAFEARESQAAIEARVYTAALLLFQHFYDRGRVEGLLSLTQEQSRSLAPVFDRFFRTYAVDPDMSVGTVLGLMAKRRRVLNTTLFGRRDTSESPDIARVATCVSQFTGVSLRDMMSQRRDQDVLTARKVAFFATAFSTKAAPEAIGAFFSRFKTTVVKTIEAVEKTLDASGGRPPAHLDIRQLLNFLSRKMPDLDALRLRSAQFARLSIQENS